MKKILDKVFAVAIIVDIGFQNQSFDFVLRQTQDSA